MSADWTAAPTSVEGKQKIAWTYDTTKTSFDLSLKYTFIESFAIIQRQSTTVFTEFNSKAIAFDTVKPVVAPVVVTPPVVKDAGKAKKKRHSCGKGAMTLVIGASTLAAASMILF